MTAFSMKKALLALTAMATAAAAVPAQAGGPRPYYGYGTHVSVGWSSGHAYRGHYKRPNYYHGSRHYRRHHKRGLSGGEAALLAAGIIGGVILIDSAIERENRRYAYEPRYAPPPRGDHYYRRDDRPTPYDDGPYGDDYDGYDDFGEDGLEDDLLGGDFRGGDDRGETYRAAPRTGRQLAGGRYNYGAAYNDCKAETRAAAGDAGLFVALPAKPGRIQPIDDGAAVRFTADYLAQDRGGGEWRRTMVCEADEGGVRFLELV